MSKEFFETYESYKPEINLKCITWEKESHGLFDYESKNIKTINCKSYEPINILKE